MMLAKLNSGLYDGLEIQFPSGVPDHVGMSVEIVFSVIRDPGPPDESSGNAWMAIEDRQTVRYVMTDPPAVDPRDGSKGTAVYEPSPPAVGFWDRK